MSAEIIQFVPRPNPNRPVSLEEKANYIFAVALLGMDDHEPPAQGTENPDH